MAGMSVRKIVAGVCTILAVSLAAFGQYPAIATAPPNVALSVSPDIPLRLVNFKFDTSRSDMLAFRYDVQNDSGEGLMAVEVSWRAEFGGSAVSIANRDDRWLTGQLPAGGRERFQVTNVPDSGAQPLTRLVATVTYAEFEDGSRLGSNAAAVGKEVDAGRRATLASYAKLLATFNPGGGDALIRALKLGSATGAPAQLPAVQEANARLLGILADRGVDAVVLELQRVSTLTLPGPGA